MSKMGKVKEVEERIKLLKFRAIVDIAVGLFALIASAYGLGPYKLYPLTCHSWRT
jgi:hypothetical protein